MRTTDVEIPRTCSLRIAFALSAVFLLRATEMHGAEDSRPKPGIPIDRCGVYLWPNWNPATMNRTTCPLAKGAAVICSWSSLEPQEGVFEFERQIGARLQAADANDYSVSLALWAAPNKVTPDWLYDRGVPAATFPERLTPFRKKKHDRCPYYLDKTYQHYYHRLLERTAAYLASLPEALRNRVVFIEVCEGVTGDPRPYYGKRTAKYWPEPLDRRLHISRTQWSDYRIATWEKYRAVFQSSRLHVPLLTKSADVIDREFAWLFGNLDVLGSKQALFCEYYQISGAGTRLGLLQKQRLAMLEAGKRWFTRGEYDAQWKLFGWSTRNPLQTLYWTAIYASHAGLDVWQIHYEALQLKGADRAVAFFNRYAGQRDASTAPAAFCALRRGLDAADTTAFPEERFGKATRPNVERYLRIADVFKHRGAYQGDPKKAVGGVMVNRASEDYNDVGWDILPGNYGRFLTQIDPDTTSIGWWHRGPKQSIYSRFARGFDVGNGKDTMSFRLADGFCKQDGPNRLLLRIIYLDEGTGSWSLSYHTSTGMKQAIGVTNTGSGRWREKTAVVPDAAMQHRGPRGADLVLASQAGDTVFHLLEVERVGEG